MSDRTKIVKTDNNLQGFNYVIEFPQVFDLFIDEYGYEFIREHCEVIIAMLITDLLTGKTKQFLEMNDLLFEKKLKEIPHYVEIFTKLLRINKAKTRNYDRRK